jgi:type VI secretion system secreted protein Hcp
MAQDAFIQIKDHDGESTDKGHEKWIEIENWFWGVDQPSAGSRSTGGAATSERVSHLPFTFSYRMDKSTTPLTKACCQGKHIPQATIQLMRATGEGQSTMYQEFKLEDVLVGGVNWKSGEPGKLPLITVELNYGKITSTYTEMDHKTGAKKGNVTFSHSLVENSVS